MDHFGFTKLIVDDLEATATFYKTVCRLTELARVSAAVNDRKIDEILFNPTGQGAATFVLWKWLDRAGATGDSVILGFQTEDVDAFVERATGAGGALVQAATDMPEHGVRVAFVTDPEDNLIEVVQVTGAWNPPVA
ncbi:VOC family protein [Sphingomonas sp. RP10(2022)]|uniref:VOC family protein n=1 Tax=Sphingomonas liriopis TaxID=2949094 RepID=A0A9X2I121_9SPHN|nr:VOC family protein [Sphingomonas liriopis]MCP3735885.1 VOC family protein [Sphingomonas liriopis]